MTALQLPCTIFQTRHRMNDYGARDMRCGDLSAQQLQHQYHLANVSAKVDPYRLKKRLPFTPSQYQFGNHYHSEEDISLQQCARILFDEFRSEARLFSFCGPYRKVIIEMINHMQYKNGTPFRHILLDMAMKDQITKDPSKNSSLAIITDTLQSNIDWIQSKFHTENNWILSAKAKEAVMPKFTRIKDIVNGLTLTIHDTWATRITLKKLIIENNTYHANLLYEIQDHFGLDDQDIMKFMVHQLPIFRIWFILQRYHPFGFRPFMTNISAEVNILGRRP